MRKILTWRSGFSFANRLLENSLKKTRPAGKERKLNVCPLIPAVAPTTPAKVRELAVLWEAWAKRCRVDPSTRNTVSSMDRARNRRKCYSLTVSVGSLGGSLGGSFWLPAEENRHIKSYYEKANPGG
jgi:hypothetical protein